MRPLHERLIGIGLASTAEFGFALAGGYAVQRHGIVDRPSADVDLFTSRDRPDISTAVDRAILAFRAAGLGAVSGASISPGPRSPIRRTVSGQRSDSHATSASTHRYSSNCVRSSIRRMRRRARWARCGGVRRPRDFIDVAAILDRTQLAESDLIRLVTERDPGFHLGIFAEMLHSMSRLEDADFTRYGLAVGEVTALRRRFADWRAEILKGLPAA
ncbi:hypothetical protein [Allonocardiopsis opalescens]|uniref:Nucleotidyltransferase AbiEii toxin of type IV toxin-antitoxin system n=1 Tax=Allonocardiopsis opalescens TaxID=1144618 RepID=A0A2T0Q028_9ACTN|nr:hypothetical protein [Allonocardiopsis opalescens]PRX97138.1 hypothetical protein CLV72_106174 [Allonocardiopsis opalescens]